jgi:hypothetical protein
MPRIYSGLQSWWVQHISEKFAEMDCDVFPQKDGDEWDIVWSKHLGSSNWKPCAAVKEEVVIGHGKTIFEAWFAAALKEAKHGKMA